LLARYPREISGGQQQRVALGRAMVRDPKVFLLDEPLSNLDARLRIRMRRDLKALHAKLGSTIVYVTHDQSEAMTLSTRIAIFNHGCLQQVAPPAEIYDRPTNEFVANFVGDREMNFVDGALSSTEGTPCFAFPGGQVPLCASVARLGGLRDIRLGVRAEAVTALPASAPGTVAGVVLVSELAGPDLFLTVRTDDGQEILARADPRAARIGEGDSVGLKLDPTRIHLFDRESGESRHHGEA
jgi:ABC-type sugar transport system ATPase subunit